MLLAGLAIVVGLILLAKAADEFVVGAVRIAAGLGISAVVVGAVVVGFGTSAPEMLVSGIAAGRGDVDLGIGNIVGSNIANLTLVLGVAALISVIHVSRTLLWREALMSTLAVGLFALLVQDGLTNWEGLVLVGALVVGLWITIAGARDASRSVVQNVGHSMRFEAGRTFVGLVGTVAGAQLLVWGAIKIAEELEISKGFVGLTLVAIGTSLPELVTGIMAARRRETGLVIGNLLGSNLFNSLAVGAVVGLLGSGPVDDPDLLGVPVLVMVVIAVVAYVGLATGRRLRRIEGAVLLASYAVSLPLMPR